MFWQRPPPAIRVPFMLVGIISDTHDRVDRTHRAVERLGAAGAQHLFHCGDLTTPEIVQVCGVLPFACVLGNNDYDLTGIQAAVEAVGGTFLDAGGVLVCGGKRFAVTHGDNARVYRLLLLAKPDYLLFGHSHHPMTERDGPTRQINPGALHRAARYTVALLDTEDDTVCFLEVK